jgi:hypothetical protein
MQMHKLSVQNNVAYHLQLNLQGTLPLHEQGLFLVSWGGVRLSPLGTSATNSPIVPAPDDR